MSNLQKLRRLIDANEKYQLLYHHYRDVNNHLQQKARNNIWWLKRKPKPLTQNQALKLKILSDVINQNKAERQNRIKQAENAFIRAQRNVNKIYGPGINATRAARLLKLAHLRAGRTVAKALASSPIIRRVEGRRRARNFIGAELSMYRRPNSTVRPSNVKARRITSL